MAFTTTRTARLPLFAFALAACTGGGGATTGSGTASATGTSGTGSTGAVTGTTGSGDTTAATTGTGSSTGMASSGSGTSTGDTTGGIKFDLGPIPDIGGGGGFMGIPETCEQAVMVQSTVGCSFHANKMQNFIEEPTSVVVGNVSTTEDVTVQLYFTPLGGAEAPEGAPVTVGPLATHEFVLSMPPQAGDVSVLRDGGTFRVESDRPIVAYQHSPISAVAHNDSSMLIPDHALGKFHIVASWHGNVDPSMFDVIAVEDGTTVSWTPPGGTAAGTGVPAVAAGATGMVVLDRAFHLQVRGPGSTDVSGTVIEADKPVWAVGASPCVNVPNGVSFCDHIEEQLIPLEYWGTTYVGAHAPTRGSENYWWRIYSAADNVTVTTTPAQPGTPVTLNRGEFHEFSTKESFFIEADGPIMPVQYLEGQNGGAGTGDPASYQMVPVEQFLPRYVFVTGKGYTENYVQIVRPAGGAEVLVDGVTVTGYYTVGGFEVADWPITEGSHSASSADPFGITVVGYTNVTSYAYPGGLALGFINPNPEG
ncbi:MAG: hypothetical protein D6705_13270 [Deltaproteobacteria bacterium]|nr:MAG: hypothetical protein D6705_13270 [Deltaproteobacteria bacterium]